MATRKRARTSATSGTTSSDSTVATIKLSGGWALPPGQVSLWRSGLLTDTVVSVEGRSFATSKLVLAGGSEYFRSHFLNEQMARGAANPTLQEHVSAAAFEPLLAFLYEGECSFDETWLTQVLQAANYLTVTPLEQAAVAALKERLSPSNALAAWSLADQLSLPELSEAAKVTALKGFDELESIEAATMAQVQALVADDRLTAKSEEAVFSAVARFAEAKQPAEADLLGLLLNVRFPLMGRSYLHETVLVSPLLQTMAGKDLLVQMLAPLVSGSSQEPRVGFGARFLHVMGGNLEDGEDADGVALSCVEVYDMLAGAWKSGVALPEAREDAAAAVLAGTIYLLGGIVGDSRINTVVAFDPEAGTWAAKAPMIESRSSHAAAVVGGKIYVIGGSSNGTRPSSMEAYDPQTGVWTEMASMPSRSRLHNAAVLDGKIYVVGGTSNTVEVYDSQTDTWTTAPPMHTSRRCHGVAALGGKIYAAGGYKGEGLTSVFLDSVEAFDPQTDSWATVAPMRRRLAQLTLTATRDRLYAIGGVIDSGDIHNATTVPTVEAYDPQRDRWWTLPDMPRPLCDHTVAAI